MSKFKEIKHIHEMGDDPDSALFSISYNEDMTEIILTLKSNESVTPQEYFNTIADFLNMVNEHPESLFVEPTNDPSVLH